MADNYMDILVAYATGYFPDFAGRLRGADPQRIAELEQLAGRPLPDDYRQYLSRMGGLGVSLSFDGSSQIDSVLAFYQRVRSSGLSLPPDCLVIGPADRVSSVALQEVAGQQPRVVTISPEGEIMPHAESLPKMLFRQVFYDGHNASSAWVGLSEREGGTPFALFSPPADMKRAQQEALALGFREEWFSDALQSCHEGNGVAISFSGYDQHRLDVLIWASAQEDVRNLGERLRGTLRLPPFRTYPAAMFHPPA